MSNSLSRLIFSHDAWISHGQKPSRTAEAIGESAKNWLNRTVTVRRLSEDGPVPGERKWLLQNQGDRGEYAVEVRRNRGGWRETGLRSGEVAEPTGSEMRLSAQRHVE